MKKFLLIALSLLLTLSEHTHALELSFFGPCSPGPLLKAQVTPRPGTSVGKLTIETLGKFKIEYKGSEAGLNSAFGTPTGLEALEVISDSEMRSYGWCFEVDGKIPELFPNAVSTSGVKEIKWFFGYAHYLNGKWISQCQPAIQILPAFLCKP